MSCIVKQKRKGTNTIYAYESTSVWIPGVGPRSKRRLIGRVDPTTGEIVPTGKRRRKKKTESESQPTEIELVAETESAPNQTKQALIDAVTRTQQLEHQIAELENENRGLRAEVQKCNASLAQVEQCLQNVKSSVMNSIDSCISTCKYN